MRSLLRFVVLPPTVTAFEQRYLAKLNRVALAFFALHVPALVVLAWLNGTRPELAALLSLAALSGPLLAPRALSSPRAISIVHGVTAMFFGALLVHFGQGPVQIEMHFYFFALIAMCAVFGNPLVIVAAAATVALHHLALWFLAPRAVFNYDAPLWVVAVHALFVALESVAGCYIARSFFDNVIGLERIVEARTRELHRRNEDLRLVLDNVGQGFATVDRAGRLSPERSRAFVAWFGAADALADAFAARSPEFATRLAVAWDALVEDVLPRELLVDQLPRELHGGGRHYQVDYRPIGEPETAEQWLVVVTDVTVEREHELAELQRRDVLQLLERALTDRRGVQDYLAESSEIVEAIALGGGDARTLRRRLHTLKGNSAIFGVASVARLCHDLESRLAEGGGARAAFDPTELGERWAPIADAVERMVGARREVVELDADDLAELEAEARRVSHHLWTALRALRLEPTARRLERFAEQARQIAARQGKDVAAVVDDGGLRVEPAVWAPFWGALVHALRNAIDHGLEGPDERAARGKPARGTLTLRTRLAGGRFVVEVSDDGRGVDWRAIARRAQALGLPSASAADLQRALLHDGLSTAAEVTELSGRGVGMGVLLEATARLGGVLSIESSPAAGTTLRMTFPEDAMVGELPAAAA